MRLTGLAFLASTFALTACGQITVPVTGQLSDGTPAAGEATARFSGKGDFWVQVAGGVRCSGNYDALANNPTIIVPVSCDDGRKGETVITRDMKGLSGSAIVTLEDGTRGQFVFGDLHFEQAFGSGGTAKTTGAVRIVE